MKVIDLLNKIANGEEVPKNIRISGWCYKFNWIEHMANYYDKHEDIDLMSALSMCVDELNKEIEILDVDYKEDKPITKESIEALGYACGEIKKLFESGWNKSIENNKIEKLNDILRIDDLYPPYDANLKKVWIQTIKNHNKINQLIDEVIKLKGE